MLSGALSIRYPTPSEHEPMTRPETSAALSMTIRMSCGTPEHGCAQPATALAPPIIHVAVIVFSLHATVSLLLLDTLTCTTYKT